MSQTINDRTSKNWEQRRLFKGDLDQPLSTNTTQSKRAHIATVSGEFFEVLAASVLNGRRGALNPEAAICPDVHMIRGNEPTLIEVKAGKSQAAFKCDARQLLKYKHCGQRVEYAFLCYQATKRSLSYHVDTIGELYEHFAGLIKYMVVVDVCVVWAAMNAGIFKRKTYESWTSADGKAFDCTYPTQTFLRQVLANGVWSSDLEGLPKLEWRERRQESHAIEISGTEFKVVEFPVVEAVRPDCQDFVPF